MGSSFSCLLLREECQWVCAVARTPHLSLSLIFEEESTLIFRTDVVLSFDLSLASHALHLTFDLFPGRWSYVIQAFHKNIDWIVETYVPMHLSSNHLKRKRQKQIKNERVIVTTLITQLSRSPYLEAWDTGELGLKVYLQCGVEILKTRPANMVSSSKPKTTNDAVQRKPKVVISSLGSFCILFRPPYIWIDNR